MEYFSGIKKNEVLIPDTTWTNLENVMLSESEINQSQITTHYMISYV